MITSQALYQLITEVVQKYFDKYLELNFFSMLHKLNHLIDWNSDKNIP